MQRTTASFSIVMLVMLAASAGAQPPAPDSSWAHGTTVNVFAGSSSGSSTTGALAGGAFGWEITPALGVEARGTWLDRGHRANAFFADLTAQVGLTSPRRVVPFAEGGIGFYRARFNDGAAVPEFYRRRLQATGLMAASQHTFTDPSFVVGGGVNVYLTTHLALRPDLNWVLVRRDAANDVLTTVSVHLAYHFERHPLMK